MTWCFIIYNFIEIIIYPHVFIRTNRIICILSPNNNKVKYYSMISPSGYILVVLRTRHRALFMVSKHSTTELCANPQSGYWFSQDRNIFITKGYSPVNFPLNPFNLWHPKICSSLYNFVISKLSHKCTHWVCNLWVGYFSTKGNLQENPPGCSFFWGGTLWHFHEYNIRWPYSLLYSSVVPMPHPSFPFYTNSYLPLVLSFPSPNYSYIWEN